MSCTCSNAQTYIPNGPCTTSGCLRIPHVYVKQEDSIYPCGETLIIDLSGKISFDLDQDNSITIFTIEEYTSNLLNPLWSLSADRSSIQLTVDSNYDNSVGQPADGSTAHLFGKLVYRIRQGELDDIGTITIPFKSYCSDVTVTADKYCDPCSGALVNVPVDISVTDDTNNSLIDIQIS
tara:strand:- start:1523 stop:2059 length:537 start_codon:yes stop_codon:yes gene_type:complete